MTHAEEGADVRFSVAELARARVEDRPAFTLG